MPPQTLSARAIRRTKPVRCQPTFSALQGLGGGGGFQFNFNARAGRQPGDEGQRAQEAANMYFLLGLFLLIVFIFFL